jgi:hypothetical protein
MRRAAQHRHSALPRLPHLLERARPRARRHGERVLSQRVFEELHRGVAERRARAGEFCSPCHEPASLSGEVVHGVCGEWELHRVLSGVSVSYFPLGLFQPTHVPGCPGVLYIT